MAADAHAMPHEGPRGEVTIIAWEAVLDGAAEGRLVARRRDLPVVGQA